MNVSTPRLEGCGAKHLGLHGDTHEKSGQVDEEIWTRHQVRYAGEGSEEIRQVAGHRKKRREPRQEDQEQISLAMNVSTVRFHGERTTKHLGFISCDCGAWMPMLQGNPKYIVIRLNDNSKVVMATHKLFNDEITAYELATELSKTSTAIVVEVLKPLYEEEDKQ
jgi:hypothetical protein